MKCWLINNINPNHKRENRMKIKQFFRGLTMVLLLLLVSCSGQQKVDTAAVRQVIDAQNQKYKTAFNTRDASGLVELFTEDATSMPPNQEILRGKAAIQRSNQQAFEMGVIDLRQQTVSLEVYGDVAHEVGKYTVTLQQEGGEGIDHTGKYVAVWKKQPDGNWLIHLEIWNSSMPLTES
ncbi:MAG: SgcJ/EcaC family oxidoreductase [Calditrichaeota bacterium]|nr:MAG: SgcJ/EcaC family oxidoreductase [Calditrichota bacterium]